MCTKLVAGGIKKRKNALLPILAEYFKKSSFFAKISIQTKDKIIMGREFAKRIPDPLPTFPIRQID